MRAVDEIILARLNALSNVTVHDGYMEVDNSTNIVTYDLPYAVYYSNIGDLANPRLNGRRRRKSVFFSIHFVGVDRHQAKALGERIRDSLSDQRIAVPGYRSWLCRLEPGGSQRIRRDDDAIRPDGSPLFYGVDEYALSVISTVTTP